MVLHEVYFNTHVVPGAFEHIGMLGYRFYPTIMLFDGTYEASNNPWPYAEATREENQNLGHKPEIGTFSF